MPKIAFFPWMTVDKVTKVGPFILTPLRMPKDDSKLTGEQKDIYRVLSAYCLHDKCRIHSATLICFEGKPCTLDLSQDEMNDIFILAEIIAFSALANRRFFEHNYVGPQTFSPVIQGYRENSDGVVLVSRKRDGENSTFSISEYYKVIKPHHIVETNGYALDVGLCEALLKLSEEDSWQLFGEAIYSFLNANSDSNSIPLPAEMVFIVGAFERLFGISNAKAQDLSSAVLGAMDVVIEDQSIPLSSRLSNRKKFLKSTSVRDIWVRDLYAARGDLAHGRRNQEYQSIWTPGEHLLLGSELFPIVVKILAQSAGVLKVTDDDFKRIHLFDHRVRAETLWVTGGEPGIELFGWKESVKDASIDWNYLREEYIRKLPEVEITQETDE